MQRRRIAALGLALVLSITFDAQALQYQMLPMDGGQFIVVALGPIVEGDSDRLRDFIFANISKGAIVGFGFDSPGGSVLEGEKLAGIVKATGGGVIVSDSSTCASACFLIFAAARTKYVGKTALIGVHSASEGTTETLAAMGVTTAMARDAAAYGVPPAIIGKMVTTEPGRMTWLSLSELASMGVQIIGQPASAPAASPPATYATPAPTSAIPLPAAPAPVASAAPMSMAFLQGRSDRQTWETWFGSLTGMAHDGALHWASQRNVAHPVLCHSAPASDDWLAGCLAAQQRLGSIDQRRKSEPDYRAGWNSL